MDYLVIGSNGFAQVGSLDFFEKNKVEMKVLMEFLLNNYPIPEEFVNMSYYKVKWFSHDFGSYSEIVLIYDDCTLNQYDENDPDKFNLFWGWFNEIESLNLETDLITRSIEELYHQSMKVKNTG